MVATVPCRERGTVGTVLASIDGSGAKPKWNRVRVEVVTKATGGEPSHCFW